MSSPHGHHAPAEGGPGTPTTAKYSNLAPNTAEFARVADDPGFVPAGFTLTERSRVIGHGGAFFGFAREALFTWQVQRGSGFEFVDVPLRVEVGAVSVFRIPFGPLHPRVVCRVYEVTDTATRAGFSHVALAGHPQLGWESYHVEQNSIGQVRLVIRVVWRPAAGWLRTAGPLSKVALELVLRRNLAALDKARSLVRAADK